jgi:hypothetical protein
MSLDISFLLYHYRPVRSKGVPFATAVWMERDGGPAGGGNVPLSPGFAGVYPSHYGLGH